jgi:membrane peptidoglycan carboxypeptidase
MIRRLLLLTLLAGVPIAILGALFVSAWWSAPATVDRTRNAAGPRSALDELTPERVEILLAVEDPAFFRHHGIDVRTPGGGWTTITQGLAKRLFFDEFEPGPWNKLRQSVAALALDRRMGKVEQLALFVDVVPMGLDRGRPVLGLGEAARAYYGTDLARLDLPQYLSLVAMIVGPDAYHVRDRPERNAQRLARIERLLAGECQPTGFRDVYYETCD